MVICFLMTHLGLLDKIIVNYWKLLSEKTSRLRRKEETSLYKIFLCGYLIRYFDNIVHCV